MKAKNAIRLLRDASRKATIESVAADDSSAFEQTYLMGFGSAVSLLRDVMDEQLDDMSVDKLAHDLREAAKGATLAVMLSDPSVMAKILEGAAREAGEKSGDANEG